MFILIGPYVRHFSDGIPNSVSNVKKINHGLPLFQNNVDGVEVIVKENLYFVKINNKQELSLQHGVKHGENESSSESDSDYFFFFFDLLEMIDR
jgi:hypothetical protein